MGTFEPTVTQGTAVVQASGVVNMGGGVCVGYKAGSDIEDGMNYSGVVIPALTKKTHAGAVATPDALHADINTS